MTSPSGGEPVVNPQPDSRLDQLTARYSLLKPRLTELEQQVKELTDGIKAELSSLLPEGRTSILLTSPHLLAPLRMQRVESWRINTTAIRAALPETVWMPWAKKSVSWPLSPVKD